MTGIHRLVEREREREREREIDLELTVITLEIQLPKCQATEGELYASLRACLKLGYSLPPDGEHEPSDLTRVCLSCECGIPSHR